MEFDLSSDQQALYQATVEFARMRLSGLPGDGEPSGLSLREAWRLCGEQGILGLAVPEEYGGLGLGALDSALAMEALGYGCPDMGLVFSIAAHVYACVVPVLAFGESDLKRRFLPRMVSGELVATHCVTEPEAGSDAYAMKTRAERRDGGYALHGSKCFSSNAPVADLFLVHAVTDPAARFLGLSAFLVEKGTPGLSVSKPYRKLGLSTAPLGDVFLEDCPVPAANRLGREGQGGAIFTHSMNWERACLFAAYLGAMARQLEETIRFAKERRQFGRPIKEFQAVSHRIADMKVRLEAARLLAYRAAWQLDRGADGRPSIDSSIAKLFVSESAVESALDAIQLHGGFGIMAEGGVERALRDAVPGRIFSGTSEIQKNTIARMLGL